MNNYYNINSLNVYRFNKLKIKKRLNNKVIKNYLKK